MENERDDRMIFLKDLLFTALYQWRKMLIFALIFAVLFGGYTGFSEIGNAKKSQNKESQQKEIAVYEETKAQMDKRIADIQMQLDSQTQYITESPLMSLNPYNLYTVSATYIVQTDYQILPGMEYQNPDKTVPILYSYVTHLEASDTLSAVADKIGIAPKYAPELVSISTSGNLSNALYVTINYNNAADAQAMLDILLNQINTIHSQVSKEMGDHEITLTSVSSKQRIDTGIAEKQALAYERQESLRSRLEELEGQLSNLSAPQFGVAASAKKIIIFAVIGFILGAFLVAGCACVCHIAGVKVYSVRTLKNRTGIKVLGSVPAYEKTTGLDMWLRKLEERATEENLFDVVAANICNYCNDAKDLLVICDCEEQQVSTLVQALRERGISVSQCGSLLYSASGLDALSKSDCAVLVARCGYSRYTDIERQMETIGDKSNLLGCVLVNG